jgi:hypothetical protein
MIFNSQINKSVVKKKAEQVLEGVYSKDPIYIPCGNPAHPSPKYESTETERKWWL